MSVDILSLPVAATTALLLQQRAQRHAQTLGQAVEQLQSHTQLLIQVQHSVAAAGQLPWRSAAATHYRKLIAHQQEQIQQLLHTHQQTLQALRKQRDDCAHLVQQAGGG